MMQIVITELDEECINAVNQADGVFTIDSRLHVHMKDDKIIYIRKKYFHMRKDTELMRGN